MLRRARIYDSHTRQWALITPAQQWEDGEVCCSFNNALLVASLKLLMAMSVVLQD